MDLHSIPAGAVIVGIDGSHHADHALDWAARHAANESRPLVLLHSIEGNATASTWLAQAGIDPSAYLTVGDTGGQAVLDAASARVAAGDAEAPILVLSRTDPRSALLEAANRASVLVVGSRGRGPVSSLLLGSVSVAVAGHATCPVVVVRHHHPGLVRRGVLVGIDGSAASLPVLEFAYLQAAELDLPLTVVHAVTIDVEEAELVVAEALAGFGEKFPEVHVERKLVRGSALGTLRALADAMDLVVVGHQTRDPLGRAIHGSTAVGLLEHAATTVAVVPRS